MEFLPNNKYLVMDRAFYESLMADIDKMKIAITAQEARNLANQLSDKLKKKFNPPVAKEIKR